MEDSDSGLLDKLMKIKLETDPLLKTSAIQESINIGSTLDESLKFIIEYKQRIIKSIPTFQKKSYKYWFKMSNLVAELKTRKENLSQKQNELELIQNSQYEILKTKKLYTKNLKIQENELAKLHHKFTKNDRKIKTYENRVVNSSEIKSQKISNFVNLIFETYNKKKISTLKDKLSKRKTNTLDLAFVIDKKQNLITDTSNLYAENQIALAAIQQENLLLRQDIQAILERISENNNEILTVEQKIYKNTDTLKKASASLVDLIEQQTKVETTFIFNSKEIQQNNSSGDLGYLNIKPYSDLSVESISDRLDTI